MFLITFILYILAHICEFAIICVVKTVVVMNWKSKLYTTLLLYFILSIGMVSATFDAYLTNNRWCYHQDMSITTTASIQSFDVDIINIPHHIGRKPIEKKMSSVVVFAKSTKRQIYEICAIFNLILWFAIAIYHITLAKKDNAFSKKNKLLLYMSFGLLFFALWSLLGLFFVSFTPIKSDLFCILSQQGGMHSYALFKATLYLTLVLRLYFSFNGTPVKWNKKLLISWALLLLFWTCINIVSGLINMKTYVVPNQYPICTISFDLFLPGLWASLDLTAVIVNSYLFISPIYVLHKRMQNADETGDNALKYVAIKQGILSLIACFTTLATMITVALFGLEPLTVGTDVNVSTMSMLLMYKWNDVFVQKFCCLRSNKNEKMKLHLEQVVIEKKSKSTKTTDSKESSEK